MAISNDLFLAILAMDSYNRGYGAGIGPAETGIVGTQIGNATRINTALPTGYQTASFYAEAYTWNNQTVISYRGTDAPLDVVNGWVTALGSMGTSQAMMAANFYQQVIAGLGVTDPRSANVTFTGHSLGGGLADLMAALYGRKAVGFDNMPFQFSAQKIYEAATASNPTPFEEQMRNNYYFNGTSIVAPNTNQITGYAVSGEALEYARNTSASTFGGTIIPTVVTKGNASTTLDVTPIVLHSQALLVALMFGNALTDKTWEDAAKYFIPALFRDDLGTAIGLQKDVNGHYGPASKMLSMISYSAIDEGTRVFGDTGIRALFNDANELGAALDSTRDVSKTLKDAAAAISKVFVQFAGQIANGKVLSAQHSSALDGILALSADKNTLAIDFNEDLWKLGTSNNQATTNIIGRKDLTDVVFRKAGWSTTGTAPNDIRPGMQWLWNDADSSIIDRIVLPTLDGAITTTIADRSQTSTKVSLFAAGSKNDTITGSADNDFIFGGSGDDTIRGGAGDDLVAGGDGNDMLAGGVGKDYISGGAGVDTVFFEGLASNGANVTIRTYEATSINKEVMLEFAETSGEVDRFIEVEKIKLSDNSDIAKVAEKPKILSTNMVVDGGDTSGVGRANARQADVLDFSLSAQPIYIDYARTNIVTDALGLTSAPYAVEIYDKFSPILQWAQFIFGALVTTGEASGKGMYDGTGLRFTNFEHVIGSAQDDKMSLWRLSPGGELVASSDAAAAADPVSNQEKWLTEARTLKLGESYANPSSVATAAAQRTAMAGQVAQNQQDVVIEAGAGNDVIVGTRTGTNNIYGQDGNDNLTAGGYASNVYGGAGGDKLNGGGFQSNLWGGDGVSQDTEADVFYLTHNSTVKDATSADYAWWGSLSLTGGVQQWWQEGKWAYWAPVTSLLNTNPMIFLGPLGLVGVFIDLATSTTVRYGLSDTNQLIVQFGRGRAGQAIIENYDAGIGTNAPGTAHITVFQQVIGDPRDASIERLETAIDLALRAGFGICIKGTDPLILDLDGDGIELIRQDAARIYFDVDNDGFAERTAWVKGDDGFLVRDLNANGSIDGISEMFGNAATPGFQALKSLDTNNDNKITAADAGFSTLRVWRDLDGDGVTDAGELKTLTELGITEISAIGGTPVSNFISGSQVRAEATFTRMDGSTGKIADILLDGNQTDSQYNGNATVSTAASALPNLRGYGNIAGLQIAMTNDATLLSSVTDFKAQPVTATWSTLKAQAADILFRWAAVDTVAATPLGTDFDARKLAFLEKYFGYQLAPRDANGAVVLNNLSELSDSWNVAIDAATIRLAVQGPWQTIFQSIPYDAAADRFFATSADSLSNSLKAAVLTLSTDSVTALAQWTTSWGPAVAAFAGAMHRVDGIEVRTDYTVASLVRALDGTAVSLSLAQLISGLSLANVLVGTSGNDALNRSTTPGLHVYVGDVGNDVMTGGSGQDVYVFGRNFGQDTIIDAENIGTQSGDRIRFAVHTASDVTMTRVGTNLVISVIGSTDKITVQNYFAVPTMQPNGIQLSPNYGVEEIQFADGAIFEVADIAAMVGKGTNGNDTIDGTSLADEIEGLKGNDLLRGGDSGDNYYYARGDGNDTIQDVMSSPLLVGSDALILVDGIAMDDLVLSRVGKGNDLTIGFTWGGDSIIVKDQFAYNTLGFKTAYAIDSRIEMFIFSMGSPWTWMDLQAAVISTYTTSGNDTTYGFGTPDEFFASAGDDFLQGLDGGDRYAFGRGAGHDTIDDSSVYPATFVSGLVGYDWGNDDVLTLQGLSQSDVTFSRTGAAPDLLVSINGTTDTLTIKGQFIGIKLDLFNLLGMAWFDRVEQFRFADGTTLTWEDVLHKVTTGDAGDNALYGAFYQDVLDGKGGTDFLSGGDDGDTYIFGRAYGSDTIQDSQTNVLVQTDDTVQFGSDILPSDVSFHRDGETKDLLITINGTSDVLRIVNQYAITETGVFGAQGFNQIELFKFADGTTKSWAVVRQDVINAARTSGNDTIVGSHFDDTFDGGAGNDLLKGWNGSDTYLFGRGSGQDVVQDVSDNLLAPGDDRVLVATDVLSTDVSVLRGNGVDVILKINDTTDTLTLKGSYDYNNIEWKPNEIERVVFADGTTWLRADIMSRALASQSTAGNDIIRGFFSDDTIVGGVGADILRGGDGADTYLFNIGDGLDVIEESVDRVFYSNEDTLQFGNGILASNVTLTRSADLADLIVSINATDSVTVKGNFEPFAYFSSFTDIEQIKFADGTIWNEESIRQKLLEAAKTSGNDTIYGFYTADIIDGGAGNDSLRGGSGSDIYLFGKGYGEDTIVEVLENHPYIQGTDSVQFLPNIARSEVSFSRVGNDLRATIAGVTDILTIKDHFINVDAKIDLFKFADGTTLTAAQAEANALTAQSTSGNDNIVGTGSDEIMDGGAGNDTLSGRGGADTYVFGRGSGIDVITEVGNYTSGPQDKVVFGVGVSLSDLVFTRSSNNLVIGINSTTDSLTIVGQFTQVNDGYYSTERIETFVFADGQSMTAAEVDARILATLSTSGNDTLLGYDSNDTLDGGLGADTLTGAKGADAYVFGRGYGQDQINELGDYAYGGPQDKILFKPDVAPAALVLSRSGNDLIMTINGTSDQLTIVGQFRQIADGYYTTNRIENFVFADGTTWTAFDVDARVLNAQATAGNDTILGYDVNETLDGGTGNDTLIGGKGSDTYVFGRGYGQDQINELGDYAYGGPTDKVQFKSGVLPTDLQFSRNGNNLTISILGTTDQLTILGQFTQLADGYNTTNRIESFEFADGTVWSMWDVDAMVLSAMTTVGNDTITGYDLGETLDGAGGNDLLIGGAGADRYIFGRGYGQDTIDERGNYSYGGPTDTIAFGADVVVEDLILSRSGADLIVRIAGTNDQLTIVGQFRQLADGYNTTNRIEFFEFVDGTRWTQWDVDVFVMRAQATGGNDTVTGFDLNEVLDGAGGNDLLIGLQGGDAYVFGHASGQDTIQDGGASLGDSVRFKAGLLASDITWSTAGNDLIGTIIGSPSDRLTIKNQFVAGANPSDRIESFIFDNGTVLTYQDILALLAGTEALPGVTIAGTIGIDALNGTTADDTYAGGLGADTINSAAGSDVFLWKTGDGNDLINEGSGSTVEIDSLRLLDVNASGIILNHVGTDLMVDILSTGERIEINAHFNSLTANWGIEQIRFADNSVWDLARINSETWYRGSIGADTITGSVFNDKIIAGGGADTLNGATGSDSYYFASGDGNDIINENNGSVVDVDVLKLTNTNESDIKVSRSGNNLLVDITSTGERLTIQAQFSSATANWGVEAIEFANGTIWDRAKMASESLIMRGTSGVDIIDGAATNDTLYGYDGNDTLRGNAGDDVIYGGAGDDTIDGGLGIDTMRGEGGNDVYIVDNAADVIVEQIGGGIDTVQSTLAIVLGTEVENAVVTGVNSVSITGNALANSLTGNAGANTLDGGLNADSMTGGGGNDIYIVDNVGDLAVESTAGGTDTVQSSVTYSLGTDVENLVLTGSNAINGTGNGGVNSLTGNSAANTLDGGIGADTMAGGLGNDSYVVDNASDIVTEVAAAGTDAILTTLASYSLALLANIENLTGLSTTGQTLTGNAAVNIILGGTGNDILIGGAGADTLNGGAGIDAVSYAGSATAVTVTIGGTATGGDAAGDILTGIENMIGGSGADSLTGDLNANTIEGGAGNDILNGGAGIDTLSYASATSAITSSLALSTSQATGGAGSDTVSNFENIWGSNFSDRLTGSTAANILTGGLGDDVLIGGAGADTLDGGTGSDTASYAGSATAVSVAIGGAISGGDATGDLLIGIENLIGGSGADSLTGDGNANLIEGGAGNDILNGGAGIDTVSFASSTTAITFNLATLVAQTTGAGSDTITNFENATGGAGADTLTGDGNANVIEGGAGNDILNGGAGIDTVSFASSTAAITFNLATLVAQTTGAGSDIITNFENATGGSGADNLTGDTLANVLFGGLGGDILNGGLGNDTLSGGTGADFFVFNTALGASNIDTISDFIVVDDSIRLENAIMTGLSATTGTLAATAFGIGSVATTATQRVIYNSTSGALFYDADGSGAGAQVQIASLTAGLSMTNADFLII